jgi:hypothetical protein
MDTLVMIDDYGLEVPLECVRECTHSGDNDAAVEKWAEKLELIWKLAPAWLEEVSNAGFEDKVHSLPARVIVQRYLWLKCWDYVDTETNDFE